MNTHSWAALPGSAATLYKCLANATHQSLLTHTHYPLATCTLVNSTIVLVASSARSVTSKWTQIPTRFLVILECSPPTPAMPPTFLINLRSRGNRETDHMTRGEGRACAVQNTYIHTYIFTWKLRPFRFMTFLSYEVTFFQLIPWNCAVSIHGGFSTL